VDGDTLHTAATVVVVLSLHKAVAVYVAVPPSFTDEGPLTVTPVSTGGTSAMVTTLLPDFVTPPLVYDAVTVTVCDDVT